MYSTIGSARPPPAEFAITLAGREGAIAVRVLTTKLPRSANYLFQCFAPDAAGHYTLPFLELISWPSPDDVATAYGKAPKAPKAPR